MTDYNVTSVRIETAQYAAMQAANREPRSRGRRRLILLVAGLAALLALTIFILCHMGPAESTQVVDLDDGRVVVYTVDGVVREREYLDEEGRLMKVETYDASGALTGTAEYAYDESGTLIAQTES